MRQMLLGPPHPARGIPDIIIGVQSINDFDLTVTALEIYALKKRRVRPLCQRRFGTLIPRCAAWPHGSSLFDYPTHSVYEARRLGL
jgi:hypothetical protein